MDPVVEWLGAVVEEAGGGRAKLLMRITERHVNGAGVAHGGVLFALADSALASAVIIPERGLTVWAHILFVAPAALGDEVFARAECSTTWGSSHLVDVQLTVGDRTVAAFRGQARTGLR